MKSEQQFDFNQNWYDLWMKQSKEFFLSADKHFKDLFSQNSFVNPEEHLKQINEWLETLKNQWEFAKLSEEQQAYQNYWKMMAKMSQDASQLMLEQWIQRTHENNPVKSIKELYELWLNCCQQVYQQALQSKSYQEAYGDFMNAALRFWKSVLEK